MCLEARINLVADQRLAGKALDAFDKLSLEGKWLLLPAMLSGTALDPGKQPFQGFSELVRKRNTLVHPKGAELLRLLIKSNDPNSLLETGLKDAANALETTKAMIAELASIFSETRPAWIDGKEHKFYSLSVCQHEAAGDS